MTVARLVAGPHWVTRRATLQTEEVPAIHDLPHCANCEIRFNAPRVSIEIPARLLSRPLRSTEAVCSANPSEMLPLPGSGRLADSLRVIVAALLPHGGPPTALKAAELIGVSRGTLFNRLTREGTSYQEIVQRVRYQAAQELLRRPGLSVKEIAHLLGYGSPTNTSANSVRVSAVRRRDHDDHGERQ